MQTVTIHDAKSNLSKYIAAVKKGKQVFIGGFGKPEVKLVLITPADLSKTKVRDFSIAKNKIIEKTDSFSDKTELLVEKLLVGKEE
jgi:prevent-host-death family protein